MRRIASLLNIGNSYIFASETRAVKDTNGWAEVQLPRERFSPSLHS
jgi:hypothetical protein